jgi:xylulokinase
MALSALIGIDIGTSSIKAAAFDATGRLLGLQRAPTPTVRSLQGWAEHDVEALWNGTAATLRALGEQLATDVSITGIAVASVGEAGVAIDREGRPVRPAIAWHDSRATAQALWWEKAVGIAEIYRITGQPLDPHYGVNKLLWIRENEPAAFSRARKWLSLADYLILRLTGICATDRSLASRTMLFDQRRLDWSNELLSAAGIEASLLPAVCVGGTRIGDLLPTVAREIGLPAGTPVAIGGHDRLCGAFAARQGGSAAVDSTGSAEAVVLPVPTYHECSAEEGGVAAHYADVVPNQYVFSARVGYAGALLDWSRRVLVGASVGDDAAAPYGFDDLEKVIPRPLAPSGLVVYPSFGREIGPCWSVATRPGIVLGLTLAHGRAQIIQALLEGSCFSLRANLEWLEELRNPLEQLRVECGAARSPTWLQLKADITGRRIDHVQLEEPTALGAALLAGVAVGLFPSHEAAGSAVHCALETISPDPRRMSEYDWLYRSAFKRLPALLMELGRITR